MIAVTLAVVLRVLAPFVSVVLLALVTAGLIYRPYRRLVEAMRGHRRPAALLVSVLLVLAVLVPLFLTAQAVSREALAFYEMSTVELTERGLLHVIEERRDLLERVNQILLPFGMWLTPQEVYDQLTTAGVRLGAFFYKQGVSVAKGLALLVFGFLFWVLVLFYLLVDGERARAWFEETLPLPVEQQRYLSHRFMEMASSLLVGNGLAGILQGVAGGVMFAALGLPGPALWGVVMALLAFIPIIGISLVYIPASVILLLAGETTRAIVLFVPLALLATFVEYWLKPMLVGRRARMHTLLVFLSLLGGLDAFGAVGLLLGPLAMTALLTLVSIYRDHYRPATTPAAP